ncbi:hypothetical protein MGLY_05820 [Neomoorella glycerini]|uniref:Uncharacterized protein n=2 Tax=Neomoorella glycerini TaxID=55779 RepID=A0A6I5ZNR8_9FIRM|nr:hypothetical protein MGLY_05820 [Moorella glycerini]
MEPLAFIHRFMDEEIRRFAWGHRWRRHDYETARTLARLYDKEGTGEQAFLEAILHIAADFWLISAADYELMQSIYPKKTGKKRSRLG